MTWIYLSVFVALVVHTAAAKKDYFSPIRLYVMAYAFFLGINSLNLSRLQTTWSHTTNLLFWGSAFMVVSFGMVIWIFDRSRGGEDLRFADFRGALAEESAGFDWDWFLKVFLACTAVFWASYFVAWLKFGAIPLLTSDPDQARIQFFGVSLITNIGMFFGPMSMMLGMEVLIFGKPGSRRKRLIQACIGITLLLYLTIAIRLDLFRFGVFAVILYHYGRKQLGFKQFAILSVLAVVIFVAIFLARVQSDAVGQLNEIVKVKMPRKYMWASQIYAYVVSNFWNMDYGFTKYVQDLGHYPHGWGFDLFRPWFFLLQLEGSMQSGYGFDGVFNESVTFMKGLNSTVYVWHFWKDFGAFGVYFLSAAAAIALSIYYANLRRAPTLFRTALWGLFASTIIFSVTAATWEFWFTYLNIIVMAIAHRKIRAA